MENNLFPEELKAPQETILKPGDARYHTLGQFFTPEPVANYMAQMAKALFAEADKQHIVRAIDPAAGEGALLSQLSKDPNFHTYGVEIDPAHRKKLFSNADSAFLGDGVNLLSELYSAALYNGYEGAPFDLYIMNPPYNLQITVPEETSEFLSVKRDFKTNRLKAMSHEFFLEAAIRILQAIRNGKDRYSSYNARAVISLHSENHLDFILRLYDAIRRNDMGLNFWYLNIGKAYPELKYNFFILLVLYRAEESILKFLDKEELLKRIRRAAFSPFQLHRDERYGEPSYCEQAENLLKGVVSADNIEIPMKSEDILPKIGVRNGNITIENPLLLEAFSAYTELQHPLTDEVIPIQEALYTSLVYNIAESPAVRPFLTVPIEKLPVPDGLTSLSPITPLQYLAFVSAGEYTAQENIEDGKGNLRIKKGENYFIKNTIVHKTHTKETEEISIDEEGEPTKIKIRKELSYNAKVLQIFNKEKELIMEVEI